jgi:2-polyprenyl-3-methyl-5-hydroxy-6-metoxy-1,4-benzoquinol methylase
LQEGGAFRYTLQSEGELVTYHELSLADMKYTPEHVSRVTLIQNDPCNMYGRLRDFDVVMVTNLTRVVDPSTMLRQIHDRMKPGATLLVFSAYDWDASLTPADKWVGGKKVMYWRRHG